MLQLIPDLFRDAVADFPLNARRLAASWANARVFDKKGNNRPSRRSSGVHDTLSVQSKVKVNNYGLLDKYYVVPDNQVEVHFRPPAS